MKLRIGIAGLLHETNTYASRMTTASAGIDVSRRKLVCVKSMVHFRAGFEPIASSIISADGLGLSTAGTELTNAVRVTIYTTRLDRFAEINEAYGAYFRTAPPARVTIGVAALPNDVQIDAVVAVPR